MPQKKPPRVAAPGDDTQAFTLEMRERLKSLKLSEEKAAGEARAVSETKVDDLIAKEADDAKISGLYAMWYVDKERDRMKQEEENPDLEVLRKRYDQSLSRLDRDKESSRSSAQKEPRKQDEPRSRGFLELTNSMDIDDIVAAAQHAAPAKKAHARRPGTVVAADDDQGGEDEDEGIAEFLEQVQQQTKKLDRVSKRVFKSPEERRQDYEDTKFSVTASTAAFGFVGTCAAAVLYGTDTAFSFGLGSFGALSYLSGLSNYADNAETPMGQAMGGRRLLVPVILVLIVTGWEKILLRVPALAETGLTPELLPVLFGFFTYVVGKVVGGMWGK